MTKSKSKTNLSSFDNKEYNPGSKIKILLWYFVNHLIFKTYWFPVQGLKRFLLRLFGAKLGKGVVLKPGLNIKYPWFLEIGHHCWIGEDVWIDNLTFVTIANDVCLSQGCLLLTGSHNYKKSSFNLIVKPIHLGSGSWIGAKAIVCQGVSVGANSILSVGSVAMSDLEPNYIYKGNPALKIRERVFEAIK